jgi:16S rRNA (uracil1498-N3)-methyltransferase
VEVMTHRFFIPPNWLTPPAVRLSGETARQIKTVLRMAPGDEIVVLDNSGLEYRVRLTMVGREEVQGQIIAQQPAQGEPQIHLTLVQGTLKGQKFEWVLQKGTELGVSRFVPAICQRSVVDKEEDLAGKQTRWERIIQEAAEQSRRGRLPVLAPAVPLAEAIRQAGGATPSPLLLMPWEESTGLTLKAALGESRPQAVTVFIGPEGGFTAAEADMARQAGVRLVTLGPRILRAETAGLAVCAAIWRTGWWEQILTVPLLPLEYLKQCWVFPRKQSFKPCCVLRLTCYFSYAQQILEFNSWNSLKDSHGSRTPHSLY